MLAGDSPGFRRLVRLVNMTVQKLPAEVAATHLRPAETALEELLGVIPRDEILDRLFSDFCIGKSEPVTRLGCSPSWPAGSTVS